MPTLRGAHCVGSSGTANSLSVTLSSSIQAGDLIIIGATTGGGSVTISVTGYTAVTAVTGSSKTQAIFYKTAVSGDAGANVTVSFSATHECGAAYIAYGSTNGFDVTPDSGQINTASTTITVAGITTVTNGDVLVWFGWDWESGGATPPAITVPSGFTAEASQANSTGGGSSTPVGTIVADMTQATAGATGNANGSISTSLINGGVLLAVAPVVSGPLQPPYVVIQAVKTANFY